MGKNLEHYVGVNIYASRSMYTPMELNYIKDKIYSSLEYVPDSMLNDTGDIDFYSAKDDISDLSEEYTDNPKHILDLMVDQKLRNNFLMSLMGGLVTVDLAEYYDNDNVSTIYVDRFEVVGNKVYLVFRIEAKDSEPNEDIFDYIDGQVSDGWGENGTDSVEIPVIYLKGSIFKQYVYEPTPEIVINDLNSHLHALTYFKDNLSQDNIDDMYKEVVEETRPSFSFKPSMVSIRLSFYNKEYDNESTS